MLGFGHSAIPEHDEFDMGLLATANPMGFGGQSTAYKSMAGEDRDDESFSPIAGNFDMSAFDGPMYRAAAEHHNAPNLTKEQRLERSGTLTGGLGRGMDEPITTTIRSGDLVASYSPTSPTSPPGLTRRMSRAISLRAIGINRAPRLRDMAQNEANRRGEPLRVLVEDEDHNDDARVDLSALEGGSGPAPVTDLTSFDPGKLSRGRTKTIVNGRNEIVVHPQANWKPFSMTWPYLLALIIISSGLAASTEILLQKSLQKPLFSFKSAEELSTWEYFMFKYLPTVCAVSFGVLWQITDFEVKRLEAYYQLSKEGGALAAESINVDYITFFNFLRPIRALRYKHYAVATSSIATLMAVSLVPTLQSACIRLQPDRVERAKHPDGEKHIEIHPVFSRILTSTLILISVFGCILLWQLTRRRTGLINDVKGIAGIAAMANRSHILMDFKNMDTASPEAIHQRLKTHRYLLQSSSLAPDDTAGELTQEEKSKYDTAVDKKHNPHPFMLRLRAGVPFLIGIILFLAFIPIVLFQRDANTLTDKAPWLLTVLAVCVKLAWGTLETDVRMIEPFYILSKRHASPKVLTLDYTAMAFLWMPIRAFANSHFLVGAVGVGSVLAEVLTVCSTSFANVNGRNYIDELFGRDDGEGEDQKLSGEETVNSFWISFILAMCILIFLCGVAIAVYARRRHPFLPRQPNTISSVLAFIHQSKMLHDFAGTEKLNNDEMVKRLAGVNKTYGLGWFAGRDGELHCGVDEEELHSNYKHGHNTRAATMTGRDVSNWERW